ncbi:MAG TPA: hypothetical protein VJ987_07285 [Anaerolineales bacterium]|nr:hypothetical protein [Anaerolineales bacterium]
MEYELSLIAALTVEADNEEEAKQYMIDALAGWEVDAADIIADEIEEVA